MAQEAFPTCNCKPKPYKGKELCPGCRKPAYGGLYVGVNIEGKRRTRAEFAAEPQLSSENAVPRVHAQGVGLRRRRRDRDVRERLVECRCSSCAGRRHIRRLVSHRTAVRHAWRDQNAGRGAAGPSAVSVRDSMRFSSSESEDSSSVPSGSGEDMAEFELLSDGEQGVAAGIGNSVTDDSNSDEEYRYPDMDALVSDSSSDGEEDISRRGAYGAWDFDDLVSDVEEDAVAILKPSTVQHQKNMVLLEEVNY